jgi:hypothetical protein
LPGALRASSFDLLTRDRRSGIEHHRFNPVADLVNRQRCIEAKTVIHKRRSRNHLLDQVESFRVGDREDDLLETFCYGIAVALGNSEGF